MSRNKITDLTPFVFEDGNVYYFQIFTFSTGNYHDLFVYEKKKFFVKKWFFKKEVVEKLVQVTIVNSETHFDIQSRFSSILNIFPIIMTRTLIFNTIPV